MKVDGALWSYGLFAKVYIKVTCKFIFFNHVVLASVTVLLYWRLFYPSTLTLSFSAFRLYLFFRNLTPSPSEECFSVLSPLPSAVLGAFDTNLVLSWLSSLTCCFCSSCQSPAAGDAVWGLPGCGPAAHHQPYRRSSCHPSPWPGVE